MSQLLRHNSSNNLQLLLNPTISSLTSSALRLNLLNSNLLHSGLWTNNNSSHHLQQMHYLEEWRLTIAQSTSTIISLLSLNQISNNRPSNRQHLVSWITTHLNPHQRQLLKHLHKKIYSVAWICLLGKHNSSHSNKFNNLSLQQNPQCGTIALRINCLILAAEAWWVMKRRKISNCLLLWSIINRLQMTLTIC